ncbi:Hsp33 family molecular chaperone HslO [Pontibacterium sp.]|jgi:molecular chaperone Hsp33|uniref:Hsp33 family molecular chaperone HslO n=1 Tax=Pontibacterium sp. TaxID=2036026 RepID=UPI003567BF98
MSNSDQIQRVLFDELDIRGVLVGLEDSYQKALEKHNYPQVIRRVLGEMMAAATVLSSNLKFKGRLILQAQGEGNVSLLMAECNDQHDLRAIARYEGELPDDASFIELLEKGRMAITIDPDQGQRYQGVVPLEGETLAACLEGYFGQSEQLPTQMHFVADDTHAAGFFLQVLPADGTGEEDWTRISHLASTLKDEELLTLDNNTLLYRLFHEEQCRLYEADPVQFRCDCSRDRSLNTLKFMTKEELQGILDEQGNIDVACQFCSEQYHFDQADLELMFSDTASAPGSDSVH